LRAQPSGRIKAQIPLVAVITALTSLAVTAVAAASSSGGFVMPPSLPKGAGNPTPPVWTPGDGAVAELSSDGRTAVPPASAPDPVKQAVYAANRITRTPYRWGGGHRAFASRAYDCSGAVSYALHGGGLLETPLDSRSFMRWGDAGPGAWITVYTNPRHAYVVIAGLRFDTSGPGERGPRWRTVTRPNTGFRVRHVPGL
jgi:cell wall-associated NlpC family hydrolase